MNTFSEARIGDILTFQRGFDITKAEQTEGEIPIVSSSGISSYHNAWKQNGPGVIIGRKGTLGTVHFVEGRYWPHDTTLWIKDFKGNDPRFLYYFLQTLHLENFDTGASNPTLNRNHLHKIKVLFPQDTDVQVRIAAVLRAYDDLIHVNNERIAVLQATASEIWREWFVRMRFPGCDSAQFVKGIPADWSGKRLDAIGSVNETSLGKTERPEVIQYVDIGAVTTNRIANPKILPIEDAPGRARRIVQHGDIIWSSVRPGNRAYCLIHSPPANLIVSTGFAVIRPKPNMPYTFLHQAVTTDAFVDEMTLVAKGAAYPATSFDDFERALILVPTDELIQRYHQTCVPMYELQNNLVSHNKHLEQARNMLLPRLIANRFDIAQCNIACPPSMREEDAPLIKEELVHA